MIVHQLIGTNKDPFLKYGTDTAVGLFDRVRRLPPELRSLALKQILDHVDPDLWSKVSRDATALQKAGRTPDVALKTALTAAMADGVIREIIARGKGSRAPAQLRGGLGHVELGAVDVSANAKRQADQMKKMAIALAGQVIKIDGRPWNYQEHNGTVVFSLIVRVGKGEKPGWQTLRKRIGPTVSRKWAKYVGWNDKINGPGASLQHMGQYKHSIKENPHNFGSWTDDEKKKAGVSKDKYKNFSFYIQFYKTSMRDARSSSSTKGQTLYAAGTPQNATIAMVVIHKEAPDKGFWRSAVGAVYDVANIASIGTLKPTVNAIKYGAEKVKDGAVYVGGKVKDVAEKVKDVVEDGIELLGDAACKLANTEIATAAAAGVGAVYGGPVGAQAGAAGMQGVKSMCGGGGGEPVPPPPMLPPPSPFPVVPVLLGVAAIGGILLLSGGKKRASTPATGGTP